MALINPPAWLQQGSYPASTDRQVIESIVTRAGVTVGFEVTQTSTASMSVNVSAGKSFIAGTSVAFQGMYNVVNDAPALVQIPASNETYPRYDLVVVRVNDADVSGSLNSTEFQVISGVPSTSPINPATPASSLVLARIYVGANATTVATANITDNRVFTAPRGGIITVPDAAALSRVGNATAGDALYAHVISSGLFMRNMGSSWTPIMDATLDRVPWTTYTPEVGGSVTVGNGSVLGYYHQIGNSVNFRIELTFGSTTAFTGNSTTLGLPSSRLASPRPTIAVGQAVAIDTSASSTSQGVALLRSNVASSVQVVFGDGVTASINMNATRPFTWATGDTLSITGTYERG